MSTTAITKITANLTLLIPNITLTHNITDRS